MCKKKRFFVRRIYSSIRSKHYYYLEKECLFRCRKIKYPPGYYSMETDDGMPVTSITDRTKYFASEKGALRYALKNFRANDGIEIITQIDE